jgi:site-specific recombinase XerD
MSKPTELPELLQGFFTKWLIGQRNVSAHTIASYRDCFRLLLQFAEKRLRRAPSRLKLGDLAAEFICAFLDDIEKGRANGVRTRNLRLTAIRSFFRYAALEVPESSALIQRVLAIPPKRGWRKVVGFLTKLEIEAILSAVDRSTWIGQRDYALLLVMVQTGLRLAEITGLRQQDVKLGAGAHVRCLGKGRKERCTPLTRPAAAIVGAWIAHQEQDAARHLFPSSRGGRLSHDAVQDLVSKHVVAARKTCQPLANRRVSPHMLRHSAAMGLLQAGIDRSLIAIWLGHESVETTQIYLDANLTLKEQILAQARPTGGQPRRYHAGDRLLNFLRGL